MALKTITGTIPQEYRGRLLEGEEAYDFSTFDFKGGCLSFLTPGGGTEKGSSWILISNRRVLYEGWVQTTAKVYSRSSGSIPISKISYVGTGTVVPPKGCRGCFGLFAKPTHTLKIVSAGGELNFRVPSEAEAQRLQALLDQLSSTG
jgi:hypothetical protein